GEVSWFDGAGALGGGQGGVQEGAGEVGAGAGEVAVAGSGGDGDGVGGDFAQGCAAGGVQVLVGSAAGERQVGVEHRLDPDGGGWAEPPGVAQGDYGHRVAVGGDEGCGSGQVRAGG